jgi:Mce-associated membrane protein
MPHLSGARAHGRAAAGRHSGIQQSARGNQYVRPQAWEVILDMAETGLPPAAPLAEQPGFYEGQPLATWGQRAVALILDWVFGLLLVVPGGVLVGIGAGIHNDHKVTGGWLLGTGALLLLLGTLVQIWQMGWRQGSRGRSWGKQVIGLQTVRASDLRLLGGWVGLGRFLLEELITSSTVLMLLDYLWPLGDRRRQTWHDKIANSVVLARPVAG